MVGSTYQGTAGSWLTGNFQGTSSQVNVLDNTANDFFLCGVQLEPGSVATPFERRNYGQEFLLCQRYYLTGRAHLGCYQAAGSAFVYQRPFSVEMRAAPSISFSGTTYANASGINTNAIQSDSFNPYAIATAAGSASYVTTFTASAEL